MEKLNFAQKTCVKSAGKLMQDTAMLFPGARIGVAVSGGVDSFVLMKTLLLRQKVVPFHFDLMALHLNPGFDPANHEPLTDWLRGQGVASHLEVTDHGPRAHSPENLKNSACFYCSRLRRKRLFTLCAHYGLTHLAFGHTVDDLAATFFMNLFQGGRVAGMGMKESFFKGELTLIRPLLWVEKKDVKRAARAWELPVFSNPCPSAHSSRRTEIMDWMELVLQKDKRYKKSMIAALRRMQLDRSIESI